MGHKCMSVRMSFISAPPEGVAGRRLDAKQRRDCRPTYLSPCSPIYIDAPGALVRKHATKGATRSRRQRRHQAHEGGDGGEGGAG